MAGQGKNKKKGYISPYPPFVMTKQAIAKLKWDVMLFGYAHDMDKFVHQLELGIPNPVQA